MIRPAWIDDGSAIPDPLGCAERNIKWLLRLRHPKSKRRMFTLDEWQRRILRKLYGPRDAEGARIVRRLVLLLPRGNRKTSLCAAIMLLHLIGPESVPGDLILSAAGAREQAFELYSEAALIVEHDRRLDGVVRVTRTKSTIECRQRSTVYKAVSADGRMQHGKTPRVIIADELHVWSGLHGQELWKALDSATVKIADTLMVIASTAGRGRENLAWREVEYALKVQRGEIADPATLPVIFASEDGDDWHDEALWHALNPGMAFGYPDLESFRDKARKAEASPADRDTFLQYNLNRWLDSSAAPFVEMSVYDDGAGPAIDLDALKGEPCWLGVDLSSTTDLSVIVAAWKDDADGFTVVPWFFIPADNIAERERLSGAPYRQWVKDGLVIATPGNVVDFRAVEAKVRELCDAFDVREIAIDPALARNLFNNLTDDGLPAIEHRQGSLSMMPAIATLERSIIGGKFRHGGNPVLRFCFANVEVETNSHGHKTRLTKSKKWLSIDGAVAAAMAVNRASVGEKYTSIYADPRYSVEDWAA